MGKTIDGEENRKVLKQHGKLHIEEDVSLEYYLLLRDNQEYEYINEDELALGYRFDEYKEMYKLCGKCGAIDKDNLVGKMCGCGKRITLNCLKLILKKV